MTTTIIQPPVTGQDINVAARAVRTLVDVLLAESGASFPPFAAMNQMVARGPVVARDELVHVLGAGLDVDELTVRAVLRQLESRGLVRQTRSAGDQQVQLELTAAGAAEHQRLRTIVARATAELYGDFDPEDLATTRRVLVTVTERAFAQLRASDA